MTVVRAEDPGRGMVKIGKADGATRIWISGSDPSSPPMPKGTAVGLHHHEGDEIFQVFSGTVRFHVDGRNIDVSAGSFVVVPPGIDHGFKVIADDTRMQFIGEIGMGEWVTVHDPDGTRRKVEIRSDVMPWHRPPLDGETFDFMEYLTITQSTAHLLEIEPTEEDVNEAGQG
jgi:uncharacterized cupin superfamily protein